MECAQLVQRERKQLVDIDRGFHGRAVYQRTVIHYQKRGPDQRKQENGRDLQCDQLYGKCIGHRLDRRGREERAAHLSGHRSNESHRDLGRIIDHRQSKEGSIVEDLRYREIFPISGSGERPASK